MLVKLTEHYQDATVHYTPEQEVEVDDTLGAWLVEHRKAVRLEAAKPVHYGAQAEPELRHDDELYEQMKPAEIEDPHPVDEPADFEPSVDRKPKDKHVTAEQIEAAEADDLMPTIKSQSRKRGRK